MSVLPITSIRSQGDDVPVHVAAAGMLYLDRGTGEVHKQVTAPAGSSWGNLDGPAKRVGEWAFEAYDNLDS